MGTLLSSLSPSQNAGGELVSAFPSNRGSLRALEGKETLWCPSVLYGSTSGDVCICTCVFQHIAVTLMVNHQGAGSKVVLGHTMKGSAVISKLCKRHEGWHRVKGVGGEDKPRESPKEHWGAQGKQQGNCLSLQWMLLWAGGRAVLCTKGPLAGRPQPLTSGLSLHPSQLLPRGLAWGQGEAPHRVQRGGGRKMWCPRNVSAPVTPPKPGLCREQKRMWSWEGR